MASSAALSPSQLSQVDGRPAFSSPDVAQLLADRWHLTAGLQVEPLDSERDQNWLVSVEGTRRYVLKVANRAEDPGVLDLQRMLLARLSERGLPCPVVVPTGDGAPLAEVEGHLAWLITVLSGAKLADVAQPSARLHGHLGELLAQVNQALAGLDHPGAHRPLQWDVQHGEQVLAAYRGAVTDPRRGSLLDRVLEAFQRHVAPALDAVQRGVIHNDVNDHNVLVTADEVTGLIDFGDAVHSVVVNDLAIACAYAMLNQPSPWRVAEAIIGGYVAVRPLAAVEREMLPRLIQTRLATSVSISAYQQTLEPHNSYLRVSEAPVWRLLTLLMEDDS